MNSSLRLFSLLFLLLILSACSPGETKKFDETTAPAGSIPYDDREVIGRINDIKNGAKPIVKPTGDSGGTGMMPPPPMQQQESAPPPPQVNTNPNTMMPIYDDLASKFKYAIIKTNFGDIKVEFYGDLSPKTVNNFLNLANNDFYDGTRFHRVIPDFMIQGGDPNSKDDDWSNDGVGGPGYKFEDEINNQPLQKGSLAMANSGANTNGSQFFIVTKDFTPWLDGKHTNFGRVIEGMDVVEKIESLPTNQDAHPLENATIEKIEPTNQ